MTRSRALTLFIVRRVLAAGAMMLAVTAVAFILLDIVPGDPAQAALGESALVTPELVHDYNVRWGLDKPLPVRYWVYLRHLARGDLGVSQVTFRPVATDLAARIPATLEITVPALLISLVIGSILGLLAAIHKDSQADHTVRIVSLVGVSTPPFWLALVAFFVFTYKLGWLPGNGRLDPGTPPPPHVTGAYSLDALFAGQWNVLGQSLAHLVLPVCVLCAYTIGMLTRFARSAVLEVLDRDYVRNAWAKGLPARVVLVRHVLRPAFLSIITVAGLVFGTLLAGAVLVERVFSWPGVGTYAYTSASNLDLPAVVGITLFVALAYIVLNLIVDLLYGVIDPRITVH